MKASLGVKLNYLLKDKTINDIDFNSLPLPTPSMSVPEIPSSNKLTAGFTGTLNYSISISGKIILMPQYQFYFGLSNEFDLKQVGVKSMRHYLFFSLFHQLSKKGAVLDDSKTNQ